MSTNYQARALASTMLPPTSLANTQLNITSVTGGIVGVSYTGLNGNNPGSNSNIISIFQATSQDFPFGTTNAPIAQVNVTGNSSGAIAIPGTFNINTAYVVGYGVGGKITAGTAQPYANICASAYIPATGTGYTALTSAMTLNDVESNFVSVNYTVLNGLTPGTNGAWAGLWIGNIPSYSTPPQFYAQITSNQAVGGPLIFNGVNIPRGALCSIGLFMSGWVGTNGGVGSVQTAMACTLQFSV
jgi:hypothetical protein